MLLKKGDGAPQDGVVQIVAQVGNHAEAGIVHQVGSAIIEDPLEQSRSDQGESDDRPFIVEVRWHKQLQAYAEAGTEEENLPVGRIGAEHAFENAADQQEAEGVQKTTPGHEDDRTK